MSDRVYPALRSAIHFHTPGRLSNAFPYRLQVAGHRSCDRSHAPIGQRFNHHTLIYTCAGAGMLRIGPASAAARPGSLAWINTSMSYQHACHPDAESWSYLWMGLEGHGLDLLHESLGIAASPVLASAETVRADAYFHQAIAAIKQKKPMLDSVCSAIAAQLMAVITGELSDAGGGQGRLNAVRQAVRSDPARRWTVDDLAGIARLSASQLFRQFRRYAGTTPLDWVRHERIGLAKQFLSATDLSVAAVASRCGYPDAFHFSRDFRRVAGMTPSGFRRAYSGRGPEA